MQEFSQVISPALQGLRARLGPGRQPVQQGHARRRPAAAGMGRCAHQRGRAWPCAAAARREARGRVGRPVSLLGKLAGCRRGGGRGGGGEGGEGGGGGEGEGE